MKFLCDRCKTRYSIGDDRVRGKILKIRCKNCANVITVREGMAEPEPIAAEAGGAARRRSATTRAPLTGSNGAQPSALGAAFQSALTSKPPAALEEEWYVSIDGAQEGPYSLTDAQAWVGARSHDADLHCWSEGFDDWLPVDKVSHFRGLRKRPAVRAPAPPPVPRIPTARAAAQAVEEEPRPLFAATMASLERSAPATSSPGLVVPPTRPSATPAGGMPAIARSNGLGSPAARVPNIPTPSITPGGSPSGKGTSPVPRAATAPAFKNQFDIPEANEGATQIEAPAYAPTDAPFDDDQSTSAEPVAAARRAINDANDAFAKAAQRHAGQPAPRDAAAPKPQVPLSALAANAPITDSTDDDDDDLAIGEVSRVVNLADLARTRPAPAERRSGPISRTGAVPRLGATGAVPRLGATGAVPRLDDPSSALAAAALEGADPALLAPPVVVSHRRGLFMLLGVATLLLAGVVVAVVMFAFDEQRATSDTILGGGEIDTTRPDDVRHYQVTVTTEGPGVVEPPPVGPKPIVKPRTPNTPIKPDVLEPPTAASLRSDEIEDMARRHSMGTQRCYMRSQKGADLILIGDVKKIQATLDIGADGTVRTVTLSQHSANNLGKCLISTIKSWKFRASAGGLYKISLQFVSS